MEWASVPKGPEDAVFKIQRLYNECTEENKVSLGIGAYRDANGQPLVLESVVRAKAALASLPPQSWTHEYLPISGHAGFVSAAQDLAFGRDLRSQLDNCLVSIQALSGTGACRLMCEFFSRFGSSKVLYIPDPTWANHKAIGQHAGLEVRQYRYIDKSKLSEPQLDFSGLIEDLSNAPRGSAVILHICAHNPTGVDPTQDQWMKIASVCKERSIQPLFDNAYQGFATGDLEGDAWSLRMFTKMGLCPMAACSFSKNMGLYAERVGALHLVAPGAESAQAALSQVKIIARAIWSNPPQFGAMIACRVMTDPKLRRLWEEELKKMSDRIYGMRAALRTKLEQTVGGSWSHVTDQIGMFSYTGLTEEQVEHCAVHGHLFMLKTGRISVAGINEGNIDHVAAAMVNAIKACPAHETVSPQAKSGGKVLCEDIYPSPTSVIMQ